MRVWVRSKKENDNLIPHSINIANAMFGFLSMGVEVVFYTSIEEIYDYVTRDDVVLGYIGEVNYILSKFNIKPETFNYPDCMSEHLGRRVWNDTIDSVYNDRSKWGNFVKPVKEKAFIGKVINSLSDLVGCGNSTEDYEVICSEPLDIKAEWRCFVINDQIVDIRPYGFKRDMAYNYDYNVVMQMLKSFENWETRPLGCSIDICVTSDNKTLLVEVNDGYALGSYGLDSLHYAKLISARWSQLLDRPDYCVFKG